MIMKLSATSIVVPVAGGHRHRRRAHDFVAAGREFESRGAGELQAAHVHPPPFVLHGARPELIESRVVAAKLPASN
jgi:hypothetical protein